jgi:putative membrane protein
MPGFLVRFIVMCAALGLTAGFIDGIEITGSNAFSRAVTLAVAAVVMGVLNAIVRPILVLLTLPLTIATLGLFLLVLNALLFWLTSRVVKGFHVRGFVPALMGTIVMTVISFLLNRLVRG